MMREAPGDLFVAFDRFMDSGSISVRNSPSIYG